MNKDDALKNIIEAKNILSSLNIDCWLTDGTLLGYYRDNDFIDHDQDLDLGALISSYNEKIVLDFIDAGWKLDNIFGKRNCGLAISLKKRKIKLDIFFFYEENGVLWHGAWRKVKDNGITRRNLIKYIYDKFELREIEFKGEKFNIPANPEKFIITKYGNGWKTPVKEWDWEFGPTNAVKTDIVI